MLKDEQLKYSALDDWFTTPRGEKLAEAFEAELLPVKNQLKGQILLQLGSCGTNPWLSNFSFQHQWIIHPSSALQKVDIVASCTKTPLARDSVDCVIAPFTMEASFDGKSPLDEIDRILKPMGYVIFFGINPFSLWGLSLRWGNLNCFGRARPGLTSAFTLNRMMMQRGYRQCALMSFYYIPPVKSAYLIRKLAFINEMGKMLWPFPSACYCLIMEKYQPCPLTPSIAALKSSSLAQDELPVTGL